MEAIAFLLGSGVSFPAGMPSVDAITELILSGQGFMRHTDGNYYSGPGLYAHAGLPDEHVPSIVAFLGLCKAEIDRYYQHNTQRRTSYEDLYYLINQIDGSESGDYDNPAVQSLIEKMLPALPQILISKRKHLRPDWSLKELASEALHYIADVVWNVLNRQPDRLNYLKCVVEACQDHRLDRVDIFTLSHDTLLEDCFSEHSIEFVDGFGNAVGRPGARVRYWQPELFGEDQARIRLFKLHGSTNWFRFHNAVEPSSSCVGIPIDGDYWHTADPDGRRQWPADGRPMLLIGTFNKMFDYLHSVYAELHCQFLRSMRVVDRLVVSGYGFGDKGINTRLIQWLVLSNRHRMAVVDPAGETLLDRARPAIPLSFSRCQDRWAIIRSGFEALTWPDVTVQLSTL